ncbi:uncharacterized protein LOC111878595 [Lactuca sativa]|uniref:uncharacterized protein LOC111878595 n=1 Tax=Lactuca sativa TaxID=4236 RepID=UPI0022AF6233|nr:uncharacterized protein LOC111878595 [Lactuca sativa]
MDLFGPINVLSINKNSYCLVVIDDFSRFTWVFFLSNKAGVADLIKKFIVLIENQTNNRVKALRTDNRTKFKNSVLDHFCAEKGIMRQYSSAHTPQQNGVAERRNRTLKDAARTMLGDSKLPVFFWAEAISTACYVQNRMLINKSQMKTPYEILYGSSSGSISNSKNVSEDEDEEVVYIPPMVSSSQPKGETPASSEGESFASPEGESSVHPDSPKSPVQNTTPDAESTPLTPIEREFMSKDSSTTTSTFMELHFPEDFSNEFVAESSSVTQSATEGGVNIHNLPVSLNDINQEIPSRIQRDYPIDNIIGQLGDAVG